MCWVQKIESFEVPHGRVWSHLDDPPRVSLPDLCASSKMENTQMPLGRSLLPPPKSPLCRSRGACKHKEECAEWCDDDGTAPRHVLSQENASKGPASSGFRSVSASLAFVFDSPREDHSLCGRSTHAPSSPSRMCHPHRHTPPTCAQQHGDWHRTQPALIECGRCLLAPWPLTASHGGPHRRPPAFDGKIDAEANQAKNLCMRGGSGV